jgi:hypothetical protein
MRRLKLYLGSISQTIQVYVGHVKSELFASACMIVHLSALKPGCGPAKSRAAFIPRDHWSQLSIA